MRLDDEDVRVAIGLRLGLELYVCSTSVQLWSPIKVDAFGRHAFVCKKAAADQFGTML